MGVHREERHTDLPGAGNRTTSTGSKEPLPPDDLAGYARLSDLVGVRIATGEEESGVRAFRRLIEQGKVDIIQPDVSRAGSLTECRRIGELALDANVRLVPHAFKTGILQAASLHLAATLPHGDLCELTVHAGPLARTLTVEDFMERLEPDGTVSYSGDAGIGSGAERGDRQSLSRGLRPPIFYHGGNGGSGRGLGVTWGQSARLL